MAAIHIIGNGFSNPARKMRCVLHIPVPLGSNAEGITWDRALVCSGLGGHKVLPEGAMDKVNGLWRGYIGDAEAHQIEQGRIFEAVVDWDLDGETWPEQRADAVAKYNDEASGLLQAVKDRLEHFGGTPE